MKIAVAGKGGVGKTTVAGTLARLFARDGRKALVVDADPSPNMALMLGIPREQRDAMRPLSSLSEVIEERTGVKPGESYGKMFILNPKVDDLVERFGATGADGVNLIVLGAIQTAGSGCFCPESALLKNLLRHLLLSKDDVVIMDMEAGVEHLSRGTAGNVDTLIAIMEPSIRSLDIARNVKAMATDLGIATIVGVVNKVRTDEQLATMRAALDETGIPLIGAIPYDPALAEAELHEATIDIGDTETYPSLGAIAAVKRAIEAHSSD